MHTGLFTPEDWAPATWITADENQLRAEFDVGESLVEATLYWVALGEAHDKSCSWGSGNINVSTQKRPMRIPTIPILLSDLLSGLDPTVFFPS